jgi:gliding motility-associated peptidyl-prolyl isomerase
MNESVELNKKLNDIEENAFLKLMKLDSLSTYHNSSNGFWYTYINSTSNKYLPKFGDKLLYTYSVFNLDHEIIYSFENIGEKSYVVDQQEIEEGLRNGLKLMKEGEVVTFLFPSYKMFGYLGDQNKISPNQPLIYKVQLNKIIKKNEEN